MALTVCLIAGAIALASNLMIGPPLWFTALNTLPFVLLGLSANWVKSKACEFTCSAIVALLPVLGFHALYLYDIQVRLPQEGGGANIGLGILFLTLPGWISAGALVGWVIGMGIKSWRRMG